MIPDHYATLGVGPTATAAEIRRARRRLLRVHHPDVAIGDKESARERTMQILVASEILLDASARADYDTALGRHRPAAARRPPRPHEAGRPERDLTCPRCRRVNVRTRRDYCLYCGEGIGDRPTPIRARAVHRRPGRSRHPVIDFGCGALAGAGLGVTLLVTMSWPFVGSFGAVVLTVLGPALVVGVAALVGGDRLWGWIARNFLRS